LTDGDRQRLRAVHLQKAARAKARNPMPNEEFWQRLAAVYKTAEAKPGVLEEHLREHPEVLEASIIFVHSKEFGDQIVDLVHKQTPRFGTYYADDHEDRLHAFARGELDCLITCHRLSQGVDFRHLRTVVLLAADRARLEAIQRIGRCLRTDPSNPMKRAAVIDLIRARDDDEQEADAKATSDDARCQWLSELASIHCEEPQ
jgi:superfamily II DNA or RNA helicase